MTSHDSKHNESTLVMTIQLAALLLVFAVPVVALLLIFPKHAEAIVLVSVYALFALSALFVGVGWSEQTYSTEAKFYTKCVIAFTVIAMAASRWYSFPEREPADWATDVLLRAAILVLPFFLGRFISSQLNRASKPGIK